MKKSRLTTKTETSLPTQINYLHSPNILTEGVYVQLEFPYWEETSLLRSVSKKQSRLAKQTLNADDVGGEAIHTL